MKRFFIALAFAAALVGCSDLKERLEKVEDGVNQLENKLANLEERLKSLESGVYITSVSEIKDENGNVTGMSFSLSQGEPIVINFSEGIKVVSTETEVTFTLTDGTVVVIPLGTQKEAFSFTIDVEGEIAVLNGQSISVGYTVTGSDEDIELYFAPDAGWSAEKEAGNSIKVTAPAYGSLNGKVVVFAGNSSNAAIAVINFEEGVANLSENSFDVVREASQLNVPVSTNLSYDVIIPEECNWLTYVETKALHDETLVFNVAANDGYKRKTQVKLVCDEKELCSFTVKQDGNTPAATVSALVGNWTVSYINQANTPRSFTMPIVESDNAERGNLILKRWFNYSKKDKEESIYATFSTEDMTLSISTDQTVKSEYGDNCAARMEDGTFMSPIVFNVSDDCSTISINPKVEIGTYYPYSGFTGYGTSYSLSKE